MSSSFCHPPSVTRSWQPAQLALPCSRLADPVAAFDVGVPVFARVPARVVVSSAPDSVALVLAPSAPAKVADSVVRRVVVFVQRLHTFWARAFKDFKHQSVDQPQHFGFVTKTYLPIARWIGGLFSIPTVSARPDSPLVRDIVSAFESGNWAPVLSLGIGGWGNALIGCGHIRSITPRGYVKQLVFPGWVIS